MGELNTSNNEENLVQEIKKDAENLKELSKNHTNYYEFLESFNNFVAKIEQNS